MVGRCGTNHNTTVKLTTVQTFFLPICVCALKPYHSGTLNFPTHPFHTNRTYHCTSDSATTTISSDADSMKFVTVFFLRVNRCVAPLRDLNPHLPIRLGVLPFPPEERINYLYSDNLKPQVMVMSLIFERSRASGSNRST